MIFTFYSYKGGVGRSMALANTADLLCREGLRVLMVDFDLEAPGLEKFFPVDHRKIRRQAGLLDLLASYKRAMARDPDRGAESGEELPHFKRLRERFIVSIYPDLPNRGRLDLLSAGRRGDEKASDDDQLARYAYALRTFDWQDFYFKWGGELFFEWLRREMHQLYDVVLVDSRTGVTEMGGVCAYQLADALVMLCASNVQNVEGILSVVHNFSSPRVERLRRGRPPQLLIVPARVEQGNPQLLEGFRQRFEKAFAAQTPPALARAGTSFWDLGIPYEPRYAFEERVAGTGEQEASPDEAFKRLVSAMALLADPASRLGELVHEPEVTRGGAVRGTSYATPQYDVTRTTARYDVFLSYMITDDKAVGVLADRLQEVGLRVFRDDRYLRSGDSWEERLGDVLANCRTCVVFVGQDGLGILQIEELHLFEDRHRKASDLRILLVLLPGAEVPSSELPYFVRGRRWVDFRAGLEDEKAFGHLVAGVRGETRGSQAAETTHADTPPYPGLAPFGEEDARYFFGREELLSPLLKRLEERRCLFLVGSSGCGKSSLVSAGLVPALRKGALPGSEQWRFVSLRPGASPVAQLAQVLAPILDPAIDSAELDAAELDAAELDAAELDAAELDAAELDAAELEAALREAPDKVTEWVERSLRNGGGLVLVVDQLEEIWTVCSEPEERDLFALRLLAGLSSLRSLRLILTLRADFVPYALEQSDLSRLLQNHQLVIQPLSRQELRRAIEEPARAAGLAFEPGLVDTILNEIDDQPGALPLLQFLLLRLWGSRQSGFLTHQAYLSSGGVRAALTSQADHVLAGFSPSDHELAQQILLRLVQLGEEGAVPTRRRADLEELLFLTDEEGTVRRVLDQLVEGHLVRVDHEEGSTAVELAHDVLITHWDRLRGWTAEERDSLRIEQRLLAAARAWDRYGGKPGDHLQGALLSEAEAWAKGREGRIGSPVKEFLTASVRVRRRQIAITALVISGVLLIGIAVLMTRSFLLRELDRSEGRLAEINRSFFELTDRAVRGSDFTTSPDGRVFVRLLGDGLWVGAADRSADPAPALLAGLSPTVDFAFSADSRTLAVAAADGSAELYDVETGIRTRLPGHEGGIHALAFRPSDQALATVGEDGMLRLWDRNSGQEMLRIPHPDQVPFSNVFFEGEWIRTDSASGTMVWDALTGQRVD